MFPNYFKLNDNVIYFVAPNETMSDELSLNLVYVTVGTD
jgi:hypothetical protein